MELRRANWADSAGAQEALGGAEQRGEERRGARWGLGDSICPVALGPANDEGACLPLSPSSGTWKCQASLGLGRQRTSSSYVSPRGSIDSRFLNSTICKNDLSLFNTYSRPTHGVRISSSGTGPMNS